MSLTILMRRSYQAAAVDFLEKLHVKASIARLACENDYGLVVTDGTLDGLIIEPMQEYFPEIRWINDSKLSQVLSMDHIQLAVRKSWKETLRALEKYADDRDINFNILIMTIEEETPFVIA
jgi:hypothetical protein